jgi:hypothetical protein
MRKVDVFSKGKVICSLELEDDLIKNLSEEEIQQLCKEILWEETVHALLGKTEVWCNPWKKK